MDISSDFSHLNISSINYIRGRGENKIDKRPAPINNNAAILNSQPLSVKRHKCHLCVKTYDILGQCFLTHLKTKHLLSDLELKTFEINNFPPKTKMIQKTTFNCNFCSRSFKGESWLSNHVNSEHKNYLDSPFLKRKSTSKAIDKVSNFCKNCSRKVTPKHKCRLFKVADTTQENIFNFSDSFFVENFKFDDKSLDYKSNYNKSTSLIEQFAETNSTKFKILHLNINSIFCKFYDVNLILNSKKFDLIFIQESKIGPQTPISTNNFYNFERRDRVAGAGGIIMYYKKVYILKGFLADDVFETIKFSIVFKSGRKKSTHTFISSYNPSFSQSKIYLDYLDNYLKKSKLNKSSCILIGDLNHDLLTDKGDNLKFLLSNYNFDSYIDKPTRITSKSSTLLDVIFCNNKDLIKSVDTFSCAYSDHNFVVAALNITPEKCLESVIESRLINKSKLDQINEQLSVISWKDLDKFEDVNDKFQFFQNLIMKIVDDCAPIKIKRVKKINLPWFDFELKNLYIQRDKLHSLAISFNNKNHLIWTTFRELRNYCKSQLKSKMKTFFESKLLSDFKDSKSFWTFYNNTIKTKRCIDKKVISAIFNTEDNEIVTEPQRIADTFTKFFTNIKIPSTISEEDSKDFINDKFLHYKRNGLIKTEYFGFQNVSVEEVTKVMEKLDSYSSAGITLIPVSIIKHSVPVLAPVITKLFNNCLNKGSFPSILKHAIAFPLHKKGDINSCDNYRGISVLSPFSKIFERLLSNQITVHFTTNKLFTSSQNGFRANHSCETALQSLLDNWLQALDQNKNILSLFIDFKKAFDLVQPNLLLLKLFHYGFNNKSLDLMSSYFSDRSMGVRIGKFNSSNADITIGVPQGSILGPLLFIIFINDMGLDLDLFTVLFADDTTFVDIDNSVDDLISKFKIKFTQIENWINYNKLFINWNKTKFMLISKDKIQPNYIVINGYGVEVVNEFKLLGVIIDNKLTFKKHVEYLQKTINQKLFAIKKIFYLPIKIKLHFFKTFILPHFDYCISLYLFFTKSLLNKLEKIYNSCLFHLLKIDLHNMTLDEQQAKLIQSKSNLFPFFYRFFYRLSLFSFKVLNNQILSDIRNKLIFKHKTYNSYNLRDKTRSIFYVQKCKLDKCFNRLSLFLPRFCNNILRFSTFTPLKQFKQFILLNISEHFLKFSQSFL